MRVCVHYNLYFQAACGKTTGGDFLCFRECDKRFFEFDKPFFDFGERFFGFADRFFKLRDRFFNFGHRFLCKADLFSLIAEPSAPIVQTVRVCGNFVLFHFALTLPAVGLVWLGGIVSLPLCFRGTRRHSGRFWRLVGLG